MRTPQSQGTGAEESRRCETNVPVPGPWGRDSGANRRGLARKSRRCETNVPVPGPWGQDSGAIGANFETTPLIIRREVAATGTGASSRQAETPEPVPCMWAMRFQSERQRLSIVNRQSTIENRHSVSSCSTVPTATVIRMRLIFRCSASRTVKRAPW